MRAIWLFAVSWVLIVVGLALTLAAISAQGNAVLEWGHPASWAGPAYLAACLVAYVLLRRFAPRADFLVLPGSLLLSGLSLLTLLSLRDPRHSWHSQALGLSLGLAAMVGVVWLLRKDRWFRWLGRERVANGCVALALLLGLAVSLLGSGAGRLNLFFFQPTHGIQLLLVLFLAGYLAEKGELLARLFTPGVPVALPRLRELLPLLAMYALPLALLLRIDLGPSVVLIGVFVAMFYTATGRFRYVAVSGVLLGLGTLAVYHLRAHFRLRVAMWLDPWGNGLPYGDQLAHSLWGLASGGTWGTGLGLGQPGRIPAAPTDLIFAALGEELGLTGTIAVLVLLFLLVYRAYRIASQAPDEFSKLLAMGLGTQWALQGGLILSGTLGLLPLTGVTVPFVSYGKSSLLTSFAALGLLLALSARASGEETTPYGQALERNGRRVLAVWGGLFLLLAGRVTQIQGFQADSLLAKDVRTRDADRVVRGKANPRFEAVIRGTIFDRSGKVVLATSRAADLTAAQQKEFFPRSAQACPEPAEGSRAEPPDRRSPSLEGRRTYPLREAAFHVLGYCHPLYASSSAHSVEARFDRLLRGYDPQRREALVRAYRARDSWLERGLLRQRVQSSDLVLTLDAGLQQEVAAALRRELDRATRRFGRAKTKGAAVVLVPRTGEILASVSRPGLDVNTVTPEQWAKAGQDRSAAVLWDRAQQGRYPPGSAFKLVTAAAALANGVELTVTCQHRINERLTWGGGYARAPGRIHDQEGMRPHGREDLREAIRDSCNVYFARLGVALGADALYAMAAEEFQLRHIPAVPDLERELPDSAYGQGQILVSPLEMARVVAAIANGGVMMEPQIVREVREHEGRVRERFQPHTLGQPISREVAGKLRDMMVAVVREGTARGKFPNVPVPVAGKTGSAENDQEDQRPHSWFVGFAPAYDPQVAFAVVVENAGYGGQAAAPVCREIIRAALRRGLIVTKSPHRGVAHALTGTTKDDHDIARSGATKQSPPRGLLRFARNDGVRAIYRGGDSP